jgi:transcriptional regulator of acetoin/glycerol metabolism
MRAILDYHWPGNVRELANVLERAQILAEGDVITPDDLPDAMLSAPAAGPEDAGPLNLDAQERRAIQEALRQTQGNKVHAAKLLGVSRRALYRLLERHGLEKAEPRSDAEDEAGADEREA